MDIKILSEEKKRNCLIGNTIMDFVYSAITIDGREYAIGKKWRDEVFSFYDFKDGSRHEFFGSPYLDIMNIHTIDSEVYILGTFDRYRWSYQLYDFSGNPFCDYGGIFNLIEKTMEYDEGFYVLGMFKKEDIVSGDIIIEYNVFGPGGSTPFGPRFAKYEGFVRLDDGLGIRAKRKEFDCMYTYGFGGIAKIGRDGSFYRVAQELHDIDGNPIYLCQKTIDDQLFLYDKEGKPLLEDVPIDEKKVGHLDTICLSHGSFRNLLWNGKYYDLDCIPNKKRLEVFGLKKDYESMIDTICYLSLFPDQKAKILANVEIVLDDLLSLYQGEDGIFVHKLLKNRLEGLIRCFHDLPPGLCVMFTGAL